jgi:hypothetical protein
MPCLFSESLSFTAALLSSPGLLTAETYPAAADSLLSRPNA